jgi:hypothetical protein
MLLRRIHLYDLKAADQPRFMPGDQLPRALVRALLKPWRGRGPGGLAKVTANLCLGLDKIGQPYELHTRSTLPPIGAPVGILHGPLDQVRRVAAQRRCISGVGVLNFADEWPTMFQDTQIAFHLQACEWAAACYQLAFGNRIRIWPVGIETEKFSPHSIAAKKFDFLIYNKLRWPGELPEPNLRDEVLRALNVRGLSYVEIGYGQYPRGRENSYHAMLARSRAMLFLCENETQGIAYNEALSMGVPLLAWNPRCWLDPNRHMHGLGECPASSVPYWDDRCGEQFHTIATMSDTLDLFLDRLRHGSYRPREYILEHLTLEKCAWHYVTLLTEALDTRP